MAAFALQIARQSVKKDISIKVVDKLRELGVLKFPQPVTTFVVESDVEKVVTPVVGATEQAKPEVDLRATLPHFDPFSPGSSGSLHEARTKVRIARLQLEAQEKAHARQAELDLRLAIRKMELDVDREVRLRELEMRAMKIAPHPTAQLDIAPSPPSPRSSPAATLVASAPAPPAITPPSFDVSKHITLVPPFKEADVYFGVFERIATALNWPREVWFLLLQCKLVAKFTGPYTVEEKLSDTECIIRTPDRKRKKRVCQINMLKTYHSHKAENALSDEQPKGVRTKRGAGLRVQKLRGGTCAEDFGSLVVVSWTTRTCHTIASVSVTNRLEVDLLSNPDHVIK
ncbi:hypothetical protein AOLI_G00217720 [Acnodon oligacanthus]